MLSGYKEDKTYFLMQHLFATSVSIKAWSKAFGN